MLQFLDQYLLNAVAADVLRVIFERVNEFNVGFVFNLYEMLPQVRLLLAEHLFYNLHLVCLWKNSASASIDLIRDVFACDVLHTSEDGNCASFDPYFSLEPIFIHVLGRKVHWSLFQTECILDLFIGPGIRDAAAEVAVRRFLQDETDRDDSVESFENSHEPELVGMVRKRLLVRDQANIWRRDRRKTSLQSGSIIDVKITKEPTNSCSLPLRKDDYEIRVEATREVSEDISDRHNSWLPESGIIDQKGEPTSPTIQSTEDSCESSVKTSNVLMPHKKMPAGRFTPKGVKFRDAYHLLVNTQSGTHFAPWAEIATSPPGVVSMHEILKEEMDKQRNEAINVVTSPLEKETRSGQRKFSMSWNEAALASSSTSPPVPSLLQIMDEEEQRLQKGSRSVTKPLQFIQDEERAIEELTQLYRENAGDEYIVRVERCATSNDAIEPSPVWANAPHFRAYSYE